MAGTQQAVEALAGFIAETVLTSASTEKNSLEGIDVSTVVDGATCYVRENDATYRYFDDSTLPVLFPFVIAPAVPPGAPGRWVATSPPASYLTQAAWYVNSATGNDNNDGLTAATPLLTLAELTRRWQGRVFAPSILAVNVYLAGTFPSEKLLLNATFPAPNANPVVTVTGAKTTVASGTVTAYQAWNSAADLRGQMTDGAQDFTAQVRRRVRLTSGAGAGGLAWIGSLGGGVTIANTSRFRTVSGTSTGSFVDPGIGDSYVVETLDTTILEYQIDCPGALVKLEDLRIATNATATISQCNSGDRGHARNTVRVAGCEYYAAASGEVQMRGGQLLLACANGGPGAGLSLYGGRFINFKSHFSWGPTNLYNVMIQSDSWMHDGNGTDPAHLLVEQGATVYDQTFRAFFGCTNVTQTALIRVNNAGFMAFNSAYLWGAAGNLKTNAVWIGNSCGITFSAATPPKATGATPGVNDAVVSNVGLAWAAITAAGYAAAPPDNGYYNIKY